MSSSLADQVDLVIGVDTHKHTHTAAVVDAHTGAHLLTTTIATTADGYRHLVAWADEHPGPRVWSVEGAGGYGAGLARHLSSLGEQVVELDRPVRARRRGGAKSDPLDAVRAAREALARPKLARPRAGGRRTELAVLLAARRSAVEAATVATRQIHALVIAAPEQLRSRLRGRTTLQMLTTAAQLRPPASWDAETTTTALVIRQLARRHRALMREAGDHEKQITALVRAWRPDLLTLLGVGPIVAAQVLCSWSHPGRVPSEAAFAMLAGVAPIPASSGMTTRYRLNRHGDRQLNRAIHVIALCRTIYDPATRDYIARRRTQGRTDPEIRRCLKRYIARDLYRRLENPPNPIDEP